SLTYCSHRISRLLILLLLLSLLNTPTTTHNYTLSLHDALPIFPGQFAEAGTAWIFWKCLPIKAFPICQKCAIIRATDNYVPMFLDRKSTRLNSSHVKISYAVFCLKKKKKQ